MGVSRILCPIDFSDASSRALEHAIVLARPVKARITALHLVSMPIVFSPGPAPGVDPAVVAQLNDRAAAHCQQVREEGIALDLIVVGGDPVIGILHHAEVLPADVIVMGTHGTGGFRRSVLGSVTEKVLRMASCPVLTVPPAAEPRALTPYGRVLCPVDFSESSLKAADYAVGVARDNASRVSLVHVIEWPWHDTVTPELTGVPPSQADALREYYRYLEASAAERLEGLAASLPRGVAIETQVRIGKPYVEVLDLAHAVGADLIVMGVRGRSALDIGFFGSTTNQVVRGARCAVMTVRG